MSEPGHFLDDTDDQLYDLVPAGDMLELRKMLWIHHMDHAKYLYGDDGEMQCSRCMIDFKRDSVEQIKRRMGRQAVMESKCWLCGKSEPWIDYTITVEAETPGGKSCPPMDVPVHHSCYMDMKP